MSEPIKENNEKCSRRFGMSDFIKSFEDCVMSPFWLCFAWLVVTPMIGISMERNLWVGGALWAAQAPFAWLVATAARETYLRKRNERS